MTCWQKQILTSMEPGEFHFENLPRQIGRAARFCYQGGEMNPDQPTSTSTASICDYGPR